MLMLHPPRTSQSDPQREWSEQLSGVFDLARAVRLIRRQFWIFLAFTVLGLSVGVAYISVAEPLYKATSSILINTRAIRAAEGASGAAMAPLDKNDPYVDNQVEVIKSDSVATAVVRKLDLTNNPLFNQEGFFGSITESLKNALGGWLNVALPEPQSEEAMLEFDIARLQAGLDVGRVMSTSVIDISYTIANPDLAADITNAYAASYLEDQIALRQSMSTQAQSRLEDRIAELSRKALAADLAIQRFRTDNNLVTAGGKLITDQQLSELNTQLTLARAETARTEARYSRIQSILDLGRADAMVGAALEDPIINSLRAKYLDTSKREAELSSRLGADHIQSANLRDEMLQYEKLILGELKRIAGSYRNDSEIAKAKEQSLKDGLAGLAGVSATENDLTPKLRELEREAETLRTLHRDLLQRFLEASQPAAFPSAEVRIISTASVPMFPSYPRKSLTLAISLVGGAILGALAGLIRELSDQSLRTGTQIREELGVEFLGSLPDVTPPVSENPSTGADQMAERREIAPPPMMRYVVQAPLSRYAETLRGVKVAIDSSLQHAPIKVIGISSVLPDEGKSTTAKNLASLIALQGARTLLIDADLRKPGLTRAIAPKAKLGLVHALIERVRPEDMILHESDTGLLFVPAAGQNLRLDTSSLLTSPSMRELMGWAKERFDYIVVDLPPIGPLVDVRAFAPQLSALLVVAEWGRTSAHAVREIALADKTTRDVCCGIILNKVDTKLARRYEPLVTWQSEEKLNRSYYQEA